MIRSVTAVATLLTMLVTTVSLPAVAQPVAQARGIDRVCPPPADLDDPADTDEDDAAAADDAAADAPPFPDAGTTHAAAIACAAAYGLVGGFPDGTFRPDEPLTRGQLASVVRSFIEVATPETLPVPDTDPFPDISTTVHRDAIAALGDTGVVAVRADGTYDVGATVSRGQMARFLTNTLGFAAKAPGAFPPAEDTAFFADVIDTAFQAETQSLAAGGVVQGTADGRYRPGADVTRGQLASILLRAADLLAEEELWQPQEPTRTALDITVHLRGEDVLDCEDQPCLDGQPLVDGKGQPGAEATATLVFDAVEGTLGYAVDLGNVQGPFDGASGIRLQHGATGINGPAVLVLATGAEVQAATGVVSGVLEGTDGSDNDVAAGITEVLADPSGFYLTIRSNDFPNGAVRGQLATE